MEVPYQQIGNLIVNAGRRARTVADCGTHLTKTALREIDKEATKTDPELSKLDASMIETLKIGGGFDKVMLAELDQRLDEACDYCGESTWTLDHLMWNCSFSRKSEIKKMRNWPTNVLTICIRLSGGALPQP